MIKLAIAGFCGKMGARIFELAKADKDFKVIFGLERQDHQSVGKVIDGVEVVSDPEKISLCDCLVDFTLPEATIKNLEYVVKYQKKAVIGTTGFDQEQLKIIKEASTKIPIVLSPNMSISVNLLFKLINLAAEILRDYKVYVEEAHHIHKKDAPSGTAKNIVKILQDKNFNIKNEDVKVIRAGQIVGDHKIIFESEFDKLEFFHSAKSRDIFAKGALFAAKWLMDKPSGLYSMKEVLGL